MIILGIETTCDETAASLIRAEKNKLEVLSSVVSSQIKLHAKWGGVVPNLAAREHLKNILPVIESALENAKIKLEDIDLMSVTNGPGLIPALLIGVSTAKTLSYLWKKPLLGIHHIEGHIYANFINRGTWNVKRGTKTNSKSQDTRSTLHAPRFPVLCLVVSGGHTQLILMKNHLDYKIVGETLDDAAGEAFDKVARILNLGYPGGPSVAALAAQIQSSKFKVQSFGINLPRPMMNSGNFNFSFSGLKTAVLYETKKHPKLVKNKQYAAKMCREFQQAVCDVLISKTLSAARKYNPKTVLLAGGVSANTELRKQLGDAIKNNLKNTRYFTPDAAYSVDNAAMIAAAAYFRFSRLNIQEKKKLSAGWKNLKADANLSL